MSSKTKFLQILRDAGVEVPSTATLTQLKTLLSETVGASMQPAGSPENVPEETNPNLISPIPISTIPNSPVPNPHVLESDNASIVVAARDDEIPADFPNPPLRERDEPNLEDRRIEHNLGDRRIEPNLEQILHNLAPPRDVEDDLEMEQLNRELARLEIKKNIMQLRRDLVELEDNLQPVQRRKIEFSEVQYAIATFTGDDTYGVQKWLIDFNLIMDSFETDAPTRLMFARRLMSGSAALFLRTITAESWDVLQREMVREFDRPTSRSDTYLQLSRRRIRRDENIRQYVLAMQDLGRHGNVGELELIQFIVDGLCDPSASVAMLYHATSIQMLKSMLIIYERNRPRQPSRPITQNPISQSQPHSTQPPTRTVSQNYIPQSHSAQPPTRLVAPLPGADQPRCYNCRAFGHIANQCPREKRPLNGCFHCFEPSHRYQDCPNRRRPAGLVAALVGTEVATNPLANTLEGHTIASGPPAPPNWARLSDVDNLNEIEPLQMVSVAFSQIGRTHSKVVLSLLDTGSPANFVQFSLVPFGMCALATRDSGCRGLGNTPLPTHGKITCYITFLNQTHIVTLDVLPDEILPTPLLLGRSFLKLYNVGLKSLSKYHIEHTLKPVLSSQTNKHIELPIPESSECHPFYSINSLDYNLFYASDLVEPSKQLLNNAMPAEPITQSPCPCDLVRNAFNEFEFVFATESELIDISNVDIGLDFGLSNRDKCWQILSKNYLEVDRSKATLKTPPMQIRLTNDTPFYCQPRRLSYSDRQEVDTICQDLLSRGIIRPSDSPYASPIVLVKKKNGETRMCVDYRALNKLTVRDNYPLPLIDYCIEHLDSKSCFSVLDLKNGFHQIKMSDESVKFTSFVTPSGQFAYDYMPFGLSNGPAYFQRTLTNILREMIDAHEIVVYMDDIVIATSDPIEHLRILEKLLVILANNGIELKLSKCRLLQSSVDYLGYSANCEGIRPNDTHIKAIRKYPVPTNAREVHSCLGLFSYFRRFVPDFSRIAVPLLNLLKSNTPFKFDKDCERAFYTLRDALESSPVLAIYNNERETEIHTDASSHGFGAVLLQRQTDNKMHPVAYYSRRTNPAESRYHSFELETLAVILALRRFGPIIGSRKPFKIVTDCSALTLTLAKKDINPKISRWVLEMEQYNYTIIHRKGSSMGHVDALSRNHAVVAAITSDEIDIHLQATQSRDPVISALCSRLENEEVDHFELKNGLVYRKTPNGRFALYVPAEMEINVIRLVHEKLGHLGFEKCHDQLRVQYWFPHAQDKIKTYIENCIRCIMHTAPKRINERTLHSIPKVPIPFDTLHIDHLGPLSNIRNKSKHILVVIDAFTKFVKLYPVNTTSTKEVCAALQKYFDVYSRPRRIIADRGTCFTSLEFASFMLDHNIEHIKTAVASPQANGQVERVNRVLTPMLGKMTEPVQHADWTRILTRVEFAINNSFHSTTQQLPSVLLFGVPQRGVDVDELTEYLDDLNAPLVSPDLTALRLDALTRIEKSQIKNELQYAKRSVPPRIYAEGDFVVIRNVDTTIGTNKKLIPKYKGPYRIHKVLSHDRYVVRDVETCQLTQLPYNGVIEAARLKPWVKAQQSIVAACFGDSSATLPDRGRSIVRSAEL